MEKDVQADHEMAMTRHDHLHNVAIASMLDITTELLYVETLDQLLSKIVRTVSETFGLAKCSIGIRDKETGLFAVRAAHGYPPEREERIRQVNYTLGDVIKVMKPEFKMGRNTYYMPAEAWEITTEDDMAFVTRPERLDRARRFPNEWHESDFIDFILYEKSGEVLGFLRIDEPMDDKIPDDDVLSAIEVFSDLAAIAIQNSELYDSVESDKKKIELLIDLIGHDVNNYAQAVSGFIELAMGRPGIPEPARKSIAKAHDQVMNLNKLVKNVKLYARVESSGDKDMERLDIITAIKEGFEGAESMYPGRTVRLRLNCDESPKLSTMNDLAKDVFLNLFTNAIKFDEHDEVVVDVGIVQALDEGQDSWLISVADNGPGIDDDLKAIVFDRFSKGPSTTLGTGLGLHIAKTLIGFYRGRIWVEDRVPGDRSKGSVFNILLPKS